MCSACGFNGRKRAWPEYHFTWRTLATIVGFVFGISGAASAAGLDFRDRWICTNCGEEVDGPDE